MTRVHETRGRQAGEETLETSGACQGGSWTALAGLGRNKVGARRPKCDASRVTGRRDARQSGTPLALTLPSRHARETRWRCRGQGINREPRNGIIKSQEGHARLELGLFRQQHGHRREVRLATAVGVEHLDSGAPMVAPANTMLASGGLAVFRRLPPCRG